MLIEQQQAEWADIEPATRRGRVAGSRVGGTPGIDSGSTPLEDMPVVACAFQAERAAVSHEPPAAESALRRSARGGGAYTC